MIKGLNFYFQILQNKTPNVLEPIPHPNDVSLDNAGLLSDMIYLLTAIGLSPGGSTHLHTNNT